MTRLLPRFKGTDTTFGDFPQRLQHVLTESIEDVTAECIIFPVYEVDHILSPSLVCSIPCTRPKENW
jgi:hypothetical protein